MAPKRKAPATASVPPVKRRASARNVPSAATVNPDVNPEVQDAPDATRASPDAPVNGGVVPGEVKKEGGDGSGSELSDVPEDILAKGTAKGRGMAKKGRKAEVNGDAAVKTEEGVAKKGKGRGKKAVKQEGEVEVNGVTEPAAPAAKKEKRNPDGDGYDPEAEGDEEVDEADLKEALARPPPVNSSFLPLPWEGRLGYACLNTYLRSSNPPVFSSRTCRIQSILEHRHPLVNPDEPEHPTKNRPDRTKPALEELGQHYVEALCLANIKDIAKMIRWNDRYGIKFFRLSSEMFPFASHAEFGYKLAPFASEALAEAGKVIAQLGHRVTTHPGQFTQLGSPRQPVIDNALRDLTYHDEMLSLLRLPEQANRDAVMILHMGGVFEGKEETLNRFRANYAGLPQSVKNRLVLENDDVSWTVHDLLPICEELNIPFVLDYHHHNIMFDPEQLREGTEDIQALYPRIKATWDRKQIKQKMHYSEPTPPAITGRQRRKHSPRPATLPPCARDMDLMIEAKDKEQAVFELMRNFKLPGYDTFNDIVPFVRADDNKAALATLNKKPKKGEPQPPKPEMVAEADIGMGGPEGRVYWPPGMEEWLRPKKREVKKKEPMAEPSKAQIKKQASEVYAKREAEKQREKAAANGDGGLEAAADSDEGLTPATKKAKAAMRMKNIADEAKANAKSEAKTHAKKPVASKSAATKAGKPKGKAAAKKAPIPSPESEPEEEMEEEEDEDLDLSDGDGEDEPVVPAKRPRTNGGGRQSGGRRAKGEVNYDEANEDEEMEEA